MYDLLSADRAWAFPNRPEPLQPGTSPDDRLRPARYSSSRLARAIGVPLPRGWSRVAAACLFVWLIGNFVWIAGGVILSLSIRGHEPPPGWFYWSLWCSAGGAIAAALFATVRYLCFHRLALVLRPRARHVRFEELLCYSAGTGMWEGERASGPSSASPRPCS